MGSGNHVRTYLNRTSRNTLIELPLVWYAEKGGVFAFWRWRRRSLPGIGKFPSGRTAPRGSERKTAREVVELPNQEHGFLKVTSVQNPSITVYLPPREKA